jgi:tripartite-type tricarboxylate transporter receptor subunit TctC
VSGPRHQRPAVARPVYRSRSTDHIDCSVRGRSSNDILARAIGQKLGDASKIPVIIENYVGASGSLGAARAAQAAPDGYTSSTYTINSAIMSKLPFDAKTSFAPVTMLGRRR